jgi:hypothetical protein
MSHVCCATYIHATDQQPTEPRRGQAQRRTLACRTAAQRPNGAPVHVTCAATATAHRHTRPHDSYRLYIVCLRLLTFKSACVCVCVSV